MAVSYPRDLCNRNAGGAVGGGRVNYVNFTWSGEERCLTRRQGTENVRVLPI